MLDRGRAGNKPCDMALNLIKLCVGADSVEATQLGNGTVREAMMNADASGVSESALAGSASNIDGVLSGGIAIGV